MIGNNFDLEVTCSGLKAATLASELLSKAATLPDFRLGGDIGESTFEVVRFTATRAYAASFYLNQDQLLVMYLSHPESTTPERARDCARAFEPLFSLIESPSGAHPTLVPHTPR